MFGSTRRMIRCVYHAFDPHETDHGNMRILLDVSIVISQSDSRIRYEIAAHTFLIRQIVLHNMCIVRLFLQSCKTKMKSPPGQWIKYTKIAKLDCDTAYHAAFEKIEKMFGNKVTLTRF